MSGSNGISSLQHLLGTLDVEAPQRTSGSQRALNSTGAAGKGALATAGGDQANVSRTGDLVALALGSSDVRSAKVAQLQQAIASGTYNVSSGDVANKIVEGLLGGR